jgi:3-phenylpropionate/trans-cinnamate dioxygenase ferredoxin reductase subunit
MATAQPIVIVGAGLAGARAAMGLRQLGFDGRVVVLGEEPDPPYERPPLSKDYLTGRISRDKLFPLSEQAWRERAVEWRGLTRVLSIDRRERHLDLAGGERLPYGKLILTMGSRPRSLDLPGSDLDGVMSVYSLADADQLRDRLGSLPRVLVIGGGFLGCELAAAARESGCEVTLVEAGDSLLPALVPVAGITARRWFREHGVDIRLQTSVNRLLGGPRIESADLTSGSPATCDLVLVCVGSSPRIGLARAAGLSVGREQAPGVLVTRRGMTSDPRIFAAGDVASFWHPGYGARLRLEHWDNAQRQGAHVAKTLLGSGEPYLPTPYFWTEQFGNLVQQVGLQLPGQEAIPLGDPAGDSFSVVLLRKGRLQACLAVNRYRDLAAARHLITSGRTVDPAQLRGPGADLREIARV